MKKRTSQFLLLSVLLFQGLISFATNTSFAVLPTIESQNPIDSDYKDQTLLKKQSRLASFLFFDFDSDQELINQSSSGDHLVLDDFSSGFRLIRNYSFTVGNPPPWHFGIPTGTPIGIGIMAGKSISSDRFIKDRSEASRLPLLNVPWRATDFSKWATGDSMTFQASGGIGFSVGVSWGDVAAGTYFFAQGQWLVYVEKTASNLAYVKITKTKIHSLGASVSGSLFDLNIELFRSADKAFSFQYDLTNQNAAFAFEDALHGNLVPTEKMATDAATSHHVTRVATSQGAEIGFLRSWYFGLPLFWGVGGSNGKIYSIDHELMHSDQSTSHVEQGIYVDESGTSGIISNHQRRINDFIATHTQDSQADGSSTLSYSGQFTWGFQQGEVNDFRFSRALKRLMTQTGLGDRLTLEIPRGQYGYLNILFEANLSQQTTDALMNQVLSNPNMIADSAQIMLKKRIETYFSDKKDVDGLCKKYLRDNENLSLSACVNRIKIDNSSSIKKMLVELREMSNFKNKNPKQFVLHFSEFGRLMISSPFTFETVLDMTQQTPVEMSLAIEGERVSQFLRDLSPAEFYLPFLFSSGLGSSPRLH